MRAFLIALALLLLSDPLSILAQDAAPLVPPPPPPSTNNVNVRRLDPNRPQFRQIINGNGNRGIITNSAGNRQVFTSHPGLPNNLTNHPLKWDAMVKDYKSKPGEITNMFTFSVTNTGTENVFVNALRPSCGCTAAQLPSTPWTLEPGKYGDIHVTINFGGKHGLVAKTVGVETSHGPQTLMIKVDVAEDPQAAAMGNRNRNQQMALVDRQAVFKGECASCHAAPTFNKHGEALFKSACSICHEAEHRAAMVPDLHALKHPTDAAYWRKWVADGKPNSLMPAFAQAQGGPLFEDQINSLVEYLEQNFKSNAAATNALPERAKLQAPATPDAIPPIPQQ